MSKKKKSKTLQKCTGGITMGELFGDKKELIGRTLVPREGDYARATVLSDFIPKRLFEGKYIIKQIFQYSDDSYVVDMLKDGDEKAIVYSIVGAPDYMIGMDLI